MPEFPPFAPTDRKRFRAEVPQAAWPNRRQPKERATRKTALADLLAALAWHVERNLSNDLGRPADRHTPAFTRHTLDRWVTFAAALASRSGAHQAPDGTWWQIISRTEIPS